MENALAAVANVSVLRRGFAVLRDVSLRVERGDFVTVVGPNGAGKTTLLKCLAGLLTPDSGTVFRARGVSVGYVPQRLSAGDAMPISARAFLSLRRRASAAAVLRIAEETAVASSLDKPLYSLSGGELQRVLTARALLDSPDLLVLDEPTQNMDVSGQLAFYELLARLYRKHKMAVLLVSHDLHLVAAATRRVVCLYRHICCEGAPQAVARDPEFIALLGGDMARMTAVYHHAHRHRHDHD
ncbi:MAG: ATP-binding cassette domain-containing protein [Gammaproteobacteria bacterium]